MSTTFLAFIIIVPMIAVLTATVITFNKKLQGKSTGKAMKFNLLTFAVIAVLVCSFTFFASAASDDTAAPAADTTAEETAQTAQTS